MRLRARLERVARAFERRPPVDPRRLLGHDEVRRAHKVLRRLGAVPHKPVQEEDAAWFAAAIRPRLPAWLAFDERQRRWERREAARLDEINRRRMRRFLGGSPARNSIGLTEEARRAARAMLGLGPEATVAPAKAWNPLAWNPDEDDDEEVLARRAEIDAHIEKLRAEMAEEEKRARPL